ncbi:SCO6745 family protein [Streptomyces alboflavus]|uniref:SCO6745 family protein n=1 Tax=Streptomyces alboflavus TaxID=67267 RepID=UPI0036B97512
MAMTSSTTSAPVGSPLHPRAGRRCHNVLNALHTTHYFSPDVGRELAPLGITHPKAVNFAIRAAALGAVGAGTVTATFFNYKPDTVARFVPEIWRTAAPEDVLAARLRAVDTTLRRLLGDEAVASPEMAEAARLALRATEACSPSGRPLYAAHAALAVPDEPHLAYWHAATLLREHRGDGHLAALLDAELDPVEALVSHTATGKSMTPTWNLNTRGWTRDDWDAAVERLRGRGLVAADGELTESGVALRKAIEERTDRLDRAPYEHLGAADVERLTELGTVFAGAALQAGAFPADLLGKA